MARFDYFIVLAAMRTGSNLLEANINAFDGLECHGEAFNPVFIGYPNRTELLGITRAERDADPLKLVDRVKQQEGALAGFRFFSSHDPRVLDAALADPRCAKIVLNRNPLDSFISLEIARATDQWKLTNVKHAKSERITFDATRFNAHLYEQQQFQLRILHALQTSGQTAFYLDYEDIREVEVMNGLSAFLESPARISALDEKLKKQNPEPHSEKVRNFDEMQSAVAQLDLFDLSRLPNFEPRRGPLVPTYVAAARSPLLYLPLRSGPDRAVQSWLAALDGVEISDLKTGFTQKTLREWKRKHAGHRSFAVLRHPLARAHSAFCDFILPTGPGTFPELRKSIKQMFNAPIPNQGPDENYDADAHRAAFEGFLRFLKANLGAQTNLRVDGNWASQSSLLQGISSFGLPDILMREDRLQEDVAYLAFSLGAENCPKLDAPTDPHAEALASIYDTSLESMAADIYQRDYEMFGFSDWRA